MIDLNNIFINLDVVLSKRTTLSNILNKQEIKNIKSKAEKNNWSDDATIEYIYRYLKENVSDFVGNSDFLDANVIIESDPYIIKAMQLMDQSQRDAEKLILDKEYKYPGCWVHDIAEALRGLLCNSDMFDTLVWDAYYIHNYSSNVNIPGWEKLQNVLEDYYDTL